LQREKMQVRNRSIITNASLESKRASDEAAASVINGGRYSKHSIVKDVGVSIEQSPPEGIALSTDAIRDQGLLPSSEGSSRRRAVLNKQGGGES